MYPMAISAKPLPHEGLGIDEYVQSTSPIRRCTYYSCPLPPSPLPPTVSPCQPAPSSPPAAHLQCECTCKMYTYTYTFT